MDPFDITINNPKRNPHREFPIEREERKQKRRGAAQESDSDIDDQENTRDVCLLNGAGEESKINVILQKSSRHTDLIKSIQYISCTDRPLILTGSTDRLVHVIDFADGNIIGTLKQGYKQMPHYHWDFPVSGHVAEQPERMTRMQTILAEVRKARDAKLSMKKQMEIRMIQSGKLNTHSFSGAQLMGMNGGDDPNQTRYSMNMTGMSDLQSNYQTQQRPHTAY